MEQFIPGSCTWLTKEEYELIMKLREEKENNSSCVPSVTAKPYGPANIHEELKEIEKYWLNKNDNKH